jgi:hypothetical protein
MCGEVMTRAMLSAYGTIEWARAAVHDIYFCLDIQPKLYIRRISNVWHFYVFRGACEVERHAEGARRDGALPFVAVARLGKHLHPMSHPALHNTPYRRSLVYRSRQTVTHHVSAVVPAAVILRSPTALASVKSAIPVLRTATTPPTTFSRDHSHVRK